MRRANLVRLPRPASRAEYEAASSEILEHLEKLPGLLAIYQTGSVSVPGISDLDHIAVVEGGRDIPDVWLHLSERTRYLAMHGPMLIDADGFVSHRSFAHAEPLVLLAGQALTVDRRPFPEYSEPLLAAEGLVTILLRLVKQAVGRRVKVRPVLCELNSIRYDLDLAGFAPGAESAWGLAERVTSVREGWFDSGTEAIRSLLPDALTSLEEALTGFERFGLGQTGSERAKRLGDPWSNVDLVRNPEPRTDITLRRNRLAAVLSGRGRWADGAELAWRLIGCAVSLPAGAYALLDGEPNARYREFREERDRIVRGYREFLERHGRGYSMMGLAGHFL